MSLYVDVATNTLNYCVINFVPEVDYRPYCNMFLPIACMKFRYN